MKTHYLVEHYWEVEMPEKQANEEAFTSTRLETKEEALALATLWHRQWPREHYRVVEVIETHTVILEIQDASTSFPL